MAQSGSQAPENLGALTAAGEERNELVAEQDAMTLKAVTAFREWLASRAKLTAAEAKEARRVARESGALVEQRLAEDARRARLAGKIITAAGQSTPERACLLRSQAVVFEALAVSLRLSAATLEANAEIAARLTGR